LTFARLKFFSDGALTLTANPIRRPLSDCRQDSIANSPIDPASIVTRVPFTGERGDGVRDRVERGHHVHGPPRRRAHRSGERVDRDARDRGLAAG